MPRNVELSFEARKTGLPTFVNNSKPRGHIANVVAVLQKCPGLLKDQCCSYTKACPTSSNDKNQVTRLKVKDLTHAKEEVDLLHVTCHAVKREHDVSCARIILVDTGHRYSGLHSICLSDSLSARSKCTVANGLQQGRTDPVQLNFVTVAPNIYGSLVLNVASYRPSVT
jgi:hypothetical protein